MRILITLLMATWLFHAVVVAETTLDTWVPASDGQFVQEKHLKALRTPFVSRGSYQYSAQSGLVWQTLMPAPSTMLADKTGIYSLDASGNRKALARDQQTGQLLLALFGGDITLLQAQFDIREIEQSLRLTPLKKPLADLFEVIEIRRSGPDERHITLTENNGNLTILKLTADGIAS